MTPGPREFEIEFDYNAIEREIWFDLVGAGERENAYPDGIV